MKIILDQTKYFKYAFDYEFSLDLLDFCRNIKEKVGFKNFNFCIENKKWSFNNLIIVDLIRAKYPTIEIDEEVQDDWKEYLIRKAEKELIIARANKIKTKTTSKLVINGLSKELNLYPYQKLGVEFFINNHGKAILGDTMGLGKSIQAISYVVHQKFQRTLVICPSSVKFVWAEEVAKWTKLKSFIFTSDVFKKEPNMDIIREHNIFIINYDILLKFIKYYSDIRWDCLIMDEFHYIKNSKSKRTKIAQAIAKRIPSILLLSGTPFLNRPVELFNGLQIMDPIAWSNWKKFTIKYCDGHQGDFGWEAKGASNIQELKERISPYFLRRKKEDVLPELPPKQLVNVPMELDTERRFEYNLAMKSFMEYLKEIKGKTNIEIKKSMQAEKLVRLGALRQITTNGKVKTAIEMINNIIDNDEKIIVFSCYNKVLKELKEKFGDSSVMLIGETNESERKGLVNSFQNDPNIKIFLGGIKSAGIGITLTKASNVLFIDYSWVPADHEQAADRAHRISQKNAVTIYQLYAKNSIDEFMKNLLEEKKQIFSQLMDDNVEVQKSLNLVDSLINEIKKVM